MPTSHSVRGAQTHVHGVIPDAANRPAGDFYKTPRLAVERLLRVEDLNGVTWEPACGDGAISETLRTAGRQVFSSDLYDRGYGVPGIDFLTTRWRPRRVDNIVTNPPFTHVQEFAERALDVARRKVILLCRLLWLEGERRRSFFQRTPLARVWVHSGRINVARNGDQYPGGEKGGMIAYAWFVWELGHVGAPTLGWVGE